MARVISGSGYYMITPPDEYEGKTYIGGRYVYEHRLIVEQKIGRSLKSTEVVDHINGNKLDNNPSNLQVLTRYTHGHKTSDQLGTRAKNNVTCGECGVGFALEPFRVKERRIVFHNRACYREFVQKGGNKNIPL